MHAEQSDGEDNASDTSETSRRIPSSSSQHTASMTATPVTILSSRSHSHFASKAVSDSDNVDGGSAAELSLSSPAAGLSVYSARSPADGSARKKRWMHGGRVRTTRCQKCVSCLAPDCGKCHSCRSVNRHCCLCSSKLL